MSKEFEFRAERTNCNQDEKPSKALNIFDNFLWAEDENTKRTLRQFGNDFELYKRSLNLLCKTTHHLCELTEKDPSKIPRAKKLILMIISRIIQSMQSIAILNLKGYYYDVKVLERCLIESMGLCAYFALNEKETMNWINGKKDKIAKIKLIDYIPLLLDLKERRGASFYGKLSGYVHANARAVASIIVDVDHEGISFPLTPIYDREKVSEISFNPTLMMIILEKIFRDELTEERKAEIMRFIRQYKAEKLKKMRKECS